MEYVRLGLSDIFISRIGFGCAGIGGYDYGKVDDCDSMAAIQKAIDLGINFFDTADVYGLGHAEEVLAKGLGKHRHDVVIATKFGVKWNKQGQTKRDLSPQRVVEALEGSLRRLKVECIPLYQIHWPDWKTPLADTLEALIKCQESGKIRFIGCCNFPASLVQEAQSYCRLESLQVPYSLSERQFEEMIDQCHQEYKMSVLTYNSLAQGLFTGKYGRHSEFKGTDLRRRSALFQGDNLEKNMRVLNNIKNIGRSHGKSPSQVAIRWVLQNSSISCAITGVKKERQIEQNVGAFDWCLSDEEMSYLEE